MSKTATETKALVPVFDLVVSELTIGTLITNAKEVHDSIIDFLETCDVENYKGTVKDAATDKAKFNALAKKLNDERIRLEKVFLKPFVPFKEIISETTALKELYLTNLDLQATLRRGAELRENRKRLAEEEARKAQIEAEKQAALMQKANAPEIPQTITTTENTTKPTYNVDFGTHEVTEVQPEKPAEKAFNFYVTMPIAKLAEDCGIKSEPILMTATMQQMLDFKNAMEKSDYIYDKSSYNGFLLINVRVKGM